MGSGASRLAFLAMAAVCSLAVAAEDKPQAPQLVMLCSKCHGAEGKSPIPGWPPIAGMSREALIAKLKGYRARLVPESRMTDVAHNFTDDEIATLADYYVGLNLQDSDKN